LKQNQEIPGPTIPESGQYYRHNTHQWLVYRSGPFEEMGDYTTIEISDCPRAGQNAYVRLADIESGTGGHVYLAPGSGPWQLPDGHVLLGIERMGWPPGLLGVSIETQGRRLSLMGTLRRLLPLGGSAVSNRDFWNGVYWMCQWVNR
jgi:hypothetical protein